MPDPGRAKPAKRVSISPPLPLPVRFALLPSLGPGKTLSPALYTLVNDIPIYLTLDPSHPPHLSLLPLFLALRPASPISILSSLHLSPDAYTLKLKGIAPHTDIWVPISLAREIVSTLGVGKLFWDEEDPTRGLLAVSAHQGISWDDGEGIGHNWLPPTSQIPRSSYSLSQILTTSMSGISIIQDCRYITTPLDHHVRLKLMAEAEKTDHTKIREGPWKDAWEDLLILTDLAWKEYRLHPSTPQITHRAQAPERSEKHTKTRESEFMYGLLPALPTLIHPSQRLNFSPSLSDLHQLLDASPASALAPAHLSQTPSSATGLPDTLSIGSLISSIGQSIKSQIGAWSRSTTKAQAEDQALLEKQNLEHREYRARMGISLVETIGGIMVSSFLTAKAIPDADLKMDREKEGKGKGQYIWIETMAQQNLDPGIGGSGQRKRENEDWSSMIRHLERRRGGSPPPSLHSHTRDTSQSHPEEKLLRSLHHEHSHSHQKPKAKPSSDLLTPPQSPQVHLHLLPDSDPNSHTEACPGERQSSLLSSSTDDTLTPAREKAYNVYSDMVISSDIEEGHMLSENGKGWQPYRLLGLAILLGFVLGRFQLV